MQHRIYRVTAFRQTAPFILQAEFNDGTSRTSDFEPILHGELLGPLRDPEEFRRVTLDPEVHPLVWPSAPHFDPEILPDWPDHEPAFKKAAARSPHSVPASAIL